MKYNIKEPNFSPISITFENEKEVSWLIGLLTTHKVCEVIREFAPEADAFFDDLYNALGPGENSDIASKFSVELGRGLC